MYVTLFLFFILIWASTLTVLNSYITIFSTIKYQNVPYNGGAKVIFFSLMPSYFWLCTTAERYKKKLLFVHSHCFWLFYSFLFFLLFLFLFFSVNNAIVCAFKLLLLSFFLFLYSVHTSHCYILFVRSYCYCSFILFFSFLILYIFTDTRCFVKWVGTLLLHFIAYKTKNGKSSFSIWDHMSNQKGYKANPWPGVKIVPTIKGIFLLLWVLNLRFDLGSDHVWEFPPTNGTRLLRFIAYKIESEGSSLRCGITCQAKKTTRPALGLRWKLSPQLLLLLCWDN